MVGTKVYRTAFSGLLSSGGLLHSDWLPPNRVIAHYHEVDLISTLLDALTAQNSPRRSRRSSPPAHIENEWLPATLTLSPPAVWTHSKPSSQLCRSEEARQLTNKSTQSSLFVPECLLLWLHTSFSFVKDLPFSKVFYTLHDFSNPIQSLQITLWSNKFGYNMHVDCNDDTYWLVHYDAHFYRRIVVNKK